MNIIFFTPVNIGFSGGFETWLKGVLKYLKEKGNYLHVIDADYPKNYKKTSMDKYIDERTTIKTKKFHKIDNEDIKRIEEITKNYDLLYYNHVNLRHERIFSKLRIKKIAAYHAPLFRNHLIYDTYLKTIGKRYLKKFDAHHVINSNDYNTLKKWKFKKIFLTPNGIDENKFNCKNKIQSRKFRILFVGRHEKQKGFDILLKAINRIQDENIEFNFTGRGSLTNDLIRIAKEKSNVRYKGFVKNLRNEYCKNDLLIMPSRQEPFGLVMIEAGASSLPVLSSNTYGARDIMINNKTGFIMERLSVQELINSINKIYTIWKDNPERLKIMGRTARAHIINKYSLNKINKRLLSMFKGVSGVK